MKGGPRREGGIVRLSEVELLGAQTGVVSDMRDDTRALYPKDWNEIAVRIKAERGNRCEFCGHDGRKSNGKHNPLTVHHLNYDPTDCRPENLVVLCAVCHLKLQHKERRRLKSAIASRGSKKLEAFA